MLSHGSIDLLLYDYVAFLTCIHCTMPKSKAREFPLRLALQLKSRCQTKCTELDKEIGANDNALKARLVLEKL